MPSWLNWNLFTSVFTVIGALAALVALVVAIWQLRIGKIGIRQSELRMQLGALPHHWNNISIGYALAPDRSLLCTLPIILKNESRAKAAEGITLEVIVPAGANLLYRDGVASLGSELKKGMAPGLEFRMTSIGEFVHLYWWIPAMNPATTALLPVPFIGQETVVSEKIRVKSKDGLLGDLTFAATFSLVFTAIVHCKDSPPCVRIFEVFGHVSSGIKDLADFAIRNGMYSKSAPDAKSFWGFGRSGKKRVLLVNPVSEPWIQDGLHLFREKGPKRIYAYQELFEKSERWLLTRRFSSFHLKQTPLDLQVN